MLAVANSLELQTSNISFLIEAVDVLFKHTNKSIFECYESIIISATGSTLPPFGTNQPSTNTLNATIKQEVIKAVCYAWETQGNIELAVIDFNSLLHSGDAFDSAMDDPSLVVTPEAICVEDLDRNDSDDVEDDCKDKVEPSISAPILLNHQHVTAFIDSGAFHSFINDSQFPAPSHMLNNFIKDLLSKTVPPPNKYQQILE
ncbi:hypothetical protein QOT17_021371 [Balamuthia mandrillaris]